MEIKDSIDYIIAINQVIEFLEKKHNEYLQKAKDLSLESIECNVYHFEEIDKHSIILLKKHALLIAELAEEITKYFIGDEKNEN